MRRFALLLLLASCGGPTPSPVPATPPAPLPPTPKAPAPPVGARWSPMHAPSWAVGRALDLGGGRRVLPGDRGQRWLLEGSKRTHAAHLLDEDLVAALRSDVGVDFVGVHGTIYRAREPLDDPYEIVRSPHPIARASATEAAIVGITNDGVALRSTDRGKSWTRLGMPALAADVAIARDGRGLLLMVPEALALTTDHGATWKPLPPPATPPSIVSIDDAGTAYAGAPRSDELWLDERPPGAIVSRAVGGGTTAQLAKDGKGAYFVSVAAFGARRAWKPLAGFNDCASTLASAHGKTVSLACIRWMEGGAKLTEALTVDGGVTFTALAARDTDFRPESWAAGPNGYLVHQPKFGTIQFRKSANAPFEPVKDRLQGAVVDEKGKQLVAFAFEYPKAKLVTSPLDKYEPTVRAELDIVPNRTAISVADDGTIVAVLNGHKELIVLRAPLKGEVQKHSLKLRADDFASGGGHVLFRHHGVLFEVDATGVAHDAGPALGAFACGAEGCVTDSAWRIGWDLPERIGEPFSVPPPEPNRPDEVAPPVTTIACTVGKKPLAQNILGELDPLAAGPLRLFADKRSVIRRATNGKLETIALLPPQGDKQETVFHALPGGVIAVRYTIAPKTPKSPETRPIRATVAWLRDTEKKPHVAELGEVGTFRIRNGDAVEADLRHAWIVGMLADGVAVQPTSPRYFRTSKLSSKPEDPWPESDPGDAPIYILRDAGGAIEKLTAPPVSDHIARRVFRTGTGWSVVARLPSANGTAEVFESKDGKTWELRLLRLWTSIAQEERGFMFYQAPDYDSSATFDLLPVATPTWSVASATHPTVFVGTLRDGLFSPRGYALAKPSTTACVSASGTTIPLRLPRPSYALSGVFYPPPLDRVAMDALDDGTTCVRTLGGRGVTIPLADPTHALVVQLGSLYEMSCTLPK